MLQNYSEIPLHKETEQKNISSILELEGGMKILVQKI